MYFEIYSSIACKDQFIKSVCLKRLSLVRDQSSISEIYKIIIISLGKRIAYGQLNFFREINEFNKIQFYFQILKEINLDHSGSIGCNEFKLVITRIPEFASTFYFRL